jgi:hypothetical protein
VRKNSLKMSLFERLSAMEDYESIREASPAAGERRRKLSFNPVPAKFLPPLEDAPPPVPAFEVSPAKRIGMHASVLNI